MKYPQEIPLSEHIFENINIKKCLKLVLILKSACREVSSCTWKFNTFLDGQDYNLESFVFNIFHMSNFTKYGNQIIKLFHIIMKQKIKLNIIHGNSLTL